MLDILKKRTKYAIIGVFLSIAVFSIKAALGVEFRRAQSFEDAHAASCRITAGASRGTGTFIGAIGESAYILTNYHVVTKNTDVILDFWTNSKKERLSGKVAWRYYDAALPADFAIIEVNAESLKNSINPPFVALGGKDAKPSINGFIVSSGAPDGRFTQAWKGIVEDYYQNATALFSPPPVPGQSGSGILEYKGDDLFLTGVLTWLIGEKGSDGSKGGAIPVSNIYIAASRGKLAPTGVQTILSPIPPDASECSALSDEVDAIIEKNDRKIFYFRADGCKACAAAAPDVSRLIRAGENIVPVDTGTKSGLDFAKSEEIKEIPCIVVYSGINKKTIEAREIIDKGLYVAFQDYLREQKETSKRKDFRERDPVRDEATIRGILHESDERWNSRQESTPKVEPPIQTPGQSDEETTARLGDRIGERIAETMGRQIEREANKLEAGVYSKLDGYAQRIEDSLTSEIRSRAMDIERGVKSTIMAAIKKKVTSFLSTCKTILFWGVVGIGVYFGLRKVKTKKEEGDKK